MRRKRILPFFFLIGILFPGLILFYLVTPDQNNTESQKEVNLYNKTEIIILAKNPEQRNINGLELSIEGRINGKGIFKQGFSDSSFYRIDTVDNIVNLSYKGDWYQDTCVILYEPIDKRPGVVTVKSKFFGSDN